MYYILNLTITFMPDWSLNVGSEEYELHCLQSWMAEFSLSVSKYEESSDDDMPADYKKSGSNDNVPADYSKSGNNVVQEDSVCQSYNLELQDLVNELQPSANCSNPQSEWHNAAIDELDAALAEAAYQKPDSASLPFSFEDFFLPETSTIQADCVPVKETTEVEKNVFNSGKENWVVPDNELGQCINKNVQEVNWNTTHKASEDHEKDKLIKAGAGGNIVELSSGLISAKVENIVTKELTVKTTEKPCHAGVVPDMGLSIYEEPFAAMKDTNTPPNNVETCEALNMKNGLDESIYISDIYGNTNSNNKGKANINVQKTSSATEKKSVIAICSTPKKAAVSNDDCVSIDNTADMNTEVKDACNTIGIKLEKDNGLIDDCIYICNTPEKGTGLKYDCVKIYNTPEKAIDTNIKITNNNLILEENTSVGSEFCTSTPEVAMTQKKYKKVSAMESSPGPSIMVPLNPQNFLLPIETSILTLGDTSIFSAYQSETFVPRFVCDCDDEISQLSPASQEKEENHCVDFTLPNLSVSSLMEKEVLDDLENDLSYFPSDLEKVLFSPVAMSVKKCKRETKPNNLLQDTSDRIVCQPPVVVSKLLTGLSDSILVTVPADSDITPEMLELSSKDDIPIFFDCLNSSIVQDNVNDLQVKDPLQGNVRGPEVPMVVNNEFGTIAHCGDSTNDTNQFPDDPANVTKREPMLFVEESGTFVDCGMDHNGPIEEHVTINEQDKAVSSELTEQFSFTYSVCEDVGGFRIDVNRCELNNTVPLVPGDLDGYATEDVVVEKPNPIMVFQSKAAVPEYITHSNVQVLEPIQRGSEFASSDLEGNCLERSGSLNHKTLSMRNEFGVETKYSKTEERPRTFNQPPQLNKAAEDNDDDELKSFTGAKCSVLAKRKKETKRNPNSKFLNLMQVVQKEVSMTNMFES